MRTRFVATVVLSRIFRRGGVGTFVASDPDVAHEEPKPQLSAALMHIDHERLNRAFADVVARAESGDWREVDAVWDELTRGLEAHLAFEERELFPPILRARPDAKPEIDRLRADHEYFRARLFDLGIRIQEHVVRGDDVTALIKRLRGHAAREDATLYRWSQDLEHAA